MRYFILFLLINPLAYAHFQVLLPSTDIVETKQPIVLSIAFTHPMRQGYLMSMAMPKQFGVLIDGRKEDLLPLLEPQKQADKQFFKAHYRFKMPADYIFFIEPSPYWEATEGRLIIHYTKVVVDAFSAQTGWDAMVGFPVEIEPLVQPYGLWRGNVFQGIVRKKGQPVPFAPIEVGYFNQDKRVTPPAEPFVTQHLKADAQGVFTYAMPRAGWWGFAALLEGEQPLPNPAGQLVPVELGAVMWIQATAME
jgi:cobalt/nickel transport protein